MDEYFRKLRTMGQKVDETTQKLMTTWEAPHLLIGGYGENVEEYSSHRERFVGDLKNLEDQLIEAKESQAKHMASTKELLSSAEDFYADIKQQTDDIETMLSDYGYKPLEDTECSPTDESETESSILTASQMEHSTDSLGESELNSVVTSTTMGRTSAMKLVQTLKNDGNLSIGQSFQE